MELAVATLIVLLILLLIFFVLRGLYLAERSPSNALPSPRPKLLGSDRLDRAIGTAMKAIGAVVLAVGVIGLIYILINGPTTTESVYRGNGQRARVTDIDWDARFNLGIALFLYCFVAAAFTASFGAIISLLHRQVTLTEAATRSGATQADDA